MQDQADLIRSTVAGILLAANTLAATRVDEERVDGIAVGDTPRIVVMIDENGIGESPAGTAVRFQVTGNLVIQMLSDRAQLSDVRNDIDMLKAQVKAALFCDPAFTTLVENVATFRVVTSYKNGGQAINGDARILVTATWREIYNPVPGPQLSGLNAKAPIATGETIVSEFLTS